MFEYFVTKVFLAGYTQRLRTNSLPEFTDIPFTIHKTPQETWSANKWGGYPQHMENMPDKCTKEKTSITLSVHHPPQCAADAKQMRLVIFLFSGSSH